MSLNSARGGPGLKNLEQALLDENSALLGQGAAYSSVTRSPLVERRHGGAKAPTVSFGGALGNLVLSVLGAGQLSLPYAFGELGLLGGIISMLSFALIGLHSLRALGDAAEVAVARGKGGSYAELAEQSLGKFVRRLLDFFQFIYAWGGAVSFLIILKQEGGYLLTRAGMSPDGGFPPGQAALLILSVCFIWPLSSLDDLSRLKRFSPLGCFCAVFITATVCAVAPWGSSPAVSSSFPDGGGGGGGGGSGGGVLDVCAGPVGSAPGAVPAGGLKLWPQTIGAALAAFPLLSFALNSSWAFVPILATFEGKAHSGPRARLSLTATGIIILNYLLVSGPGACERPFLKYLLWCPAWCETLTRDCAGRVAAWQCFAAW
jgi:hypothetical protein